MAVKRIVRSVKSIVINDNKFEIIFDIHYPKYAGHAELVQYKAIGEIIPTMYIDSYGREHKTKSASRWTTIYVRESFDKGRFVLARSNHDTDIAFIGKKVLKEIGIDYSKGQY